MITTAASTGTNSGFPGGGGTSGRLGAGSAADSAGADVMSATPVIALRDLTKVYGEGDTTVHALRGVSLDIAAGEYVAIMGASGSGKSTLMHIIGCLDVGTAGRYLLDGVDVATLDCVRAVGVCATARSASCSRAST